MAKTIVAFGYHDQSAPRHWNTGKILQEEGFDIIECHTIKEGFFAKYQDLWKQFRKKGKRTDAVIVTFPGHYLVPLAWTLTRIPRKHLIFDAFVSLFDTLVYDRQKYSFWHPFAWFLWLVDYCTCHIADEIWIDTQEHKKYFAKTFFLNPKRIRVVYLGTREDLFYPMSSPMCSPQGDTLEILFYGTYLPLQGIESIIDAAKILQNKNLPIHFTLIGSGQTYSAMRERAEKYKLKNITFEPRIPYEKLPDRIRAASLCLGIFGTTAKTKRVIPHKVYDAIGCGIPIITADTPAIREKFTNDKEVILCKAGDAEDLAEKIEKFHALHFFKRKSPIANASMPEQ